MKIKSHKNMKINKKNKRILLYSFLAVFTIISIIILSYSDLSHLKNNSVATDLSFDSHPAIVNHLNEVAKSKVDSNGEEFNKFYDGTYNGADWCAMFIWWLFNQDGRAKNFIVKNAYADNLVRDSLNAGLGTWHEDNCTDPTTQPRVGDLVVFDPTKDKNDYNSPYVPLPKYLGELENFNDHDKYISSHIGYVYKVDNDYIYTIEGNTGSINPLSSKVSMKSYPYKKQCGVETTDVSKRGINGYYRPNYAPHYTVKYMPNATDVKGSMSIQYFKQGESRKLLPNGFTRPNYRFFGWVAQRDDGTVYCYDSPGKVAKWTNSSCYAHYYFSDQQELTNSYGNDGVIYMYAQWQKVSYEDSNPQKSSSSTATQVTPNTIKTPTSSSNNTSGSSSTRSITYYCPSGYTKIGDGANAYCQKAVISECYCPSGYKRMGNSPKNYYCQSQKATHYEYYCPSGYTKAGDGPSAYCVSNKAVGYNYVCPSGYKRMGNSANNYYCQSQKATGYEYYCPSGYKRMGNSPKNYYCQSKKATGYRYYCDSGYQIIGGGSAAYCQSKKATHYEYYCVSGWTKVGKDKNAHCESNSAKTYYCPSGYTKAGDGPSAYCFKGSTKNGNYKQTKILSKPVTTPVKVRNGYKTTKTKKANEYGTTRILIRNKYDIKKITLTNKYDYVSIKKKNGYATTKIKTKKSYVTTKILTK